jgi:predicted PurR-regulated permease PerM
MRTDRNPTRPNRDLWTDGLGRAAVRSLQVLLVVALVVVVAYAGVSLRLVVVPFLIATLIAAAAAPLVAWLGRRGVPRTLGVWLTMLAGLGAIGGTGWLVGRAVTDQWDELVQGAQEGLDELLRFLTEGPLGLSQQQLDAALQSLAELLQSSGVQSGAISGATLIAEVITGILLGFVLLFFVLRDGDQIWAFIRQFLPERDDDRYEVVAARSVDVLGGYVRGTAVIAFVDAVLIGIALAVLQVPLALPLAAVVFLGAFVPLVGATVAGALAALIALVSNGLVTALIVVAVVVAINQIEGDVLAPVVLGRSLSLHPLAILLALTAGTILAGIIGAILAVPFAALAWMVVSTWREPPPVHEPPEPSADPQGAVP